jgi:hypothetical protein
VGYGDHNFLLANAINILRFEVDKNQMLGEGKQMLERKEAEGTLMQIQHLALELLRRCGMIFESQIATLAERWFGPPIVKLKSSLQFSHFL